MFFYPRKLQLFVTTMQSMIVFFVQLVAIGSTTADAMRANSLPVSAVCHSPTPEAVAEVILTNHRAPADDVTS